MARQGDRRRRVAADEAGAAPGESVQVRRPCVRPTPGTQVVGARGVQSDQDDALRRRGPGGRRGGQGGRAEQEKAEESPPQRGSHLSLPSTGTYWWYLHREPTRPWRA